MLPPVVCDAGLKPYSYRQAPLGSLYALGMALPIYLGPTASHGIWATTVSNVESQVFKPYHFGSIAGIRTPDYQAYVLTTQPWFSFIMIYDIYHLTERYT